MSYVLDLIRFIVESTASQDDRRPSGNLQPLDISCQLLLTFRLKILELSGIGDPSVLRAAGVDVAIDLPGVGSNIQEHTYLGLLHSSSLSILRLLYTCRTAPTRLPLEIRKEVEDDFLTFDCLSKPEELAKNLELLWVFSFSAQFALT